MALSEDRSEEITRYVSGIWSNIMGIHDRQYTYDTDLFPSIAGIAKACGGFLEDTYIAGMWKRNLHTELVWEMRGAPPGSLDTTLEDICHPAPYIAPSWSWASRFKYGFEFIVPDAYIIPGTSGSDPAPHGFVACEGAPSHIRSEVTFIDYNVALEFDKPYGRIKHASLILRGKLVPLPPIITSLPRSNERHRQDHLADKLGTVTFDWKVPIDAAQEVRDLKILLLASCCQATSNEVLEYWANPEEDHAATFSEGPPAIGVGETGSSYGKENEVLTCLSCGDKDRGRNGWGIILHPAHISGAYVRVGVCQLYGGSGALNIFRDEVDRDVKIV
ncbi:hypothetical protein DL768_009159 [Monosporascus sp. mg162]|nr:hypothetical protein DL768_009159 [Monosporascus sp. mg162]